MKKPGRAMLPTDKVRFVGDPIACVVAETLLQAKDAAEAIELDIEPLPVVVDFTKADAEGAPAIFEDIPDNVALDYHYGDTEKVNAAFASAAHKVKLKILELAAGRQRDGAARRGRRIRQGQGQLHAAFGQPGRDGAEGRHRRRHEDHAGQGAHPAPAMSAARSA